MTALLEAKEILSGCLFVPMERIEDDASMQSIKELDSLSFAAIATELEDRLGRPIDPVDLIKLRTVRDLAVLIERYR
ncbi:acyl carrier protein [Dyella amyloliquefaciens]|uniref:acyl carrier protein n=1 Tax=Dyella amyloliquefaciens TaxID=1770545 RepID=UPI0013EE78E8|nr:acyl carrier protein [Dyella amyloliquefaciens]